MINKAKDGSAPSGISSFLQREHGLFINGGWEAPSSAAGIDVLDPATGGVVARVPSADATDIDAAVRSAHAAFPGWSSLPPAGRERILLRLADLVEQHSEELAQLETLNQGKSIAIARMVDIGGAPAFIRYVAGLTTKLHGETFDVSIQFPGSKFTAFTKREPIGVIAAIAPWNFPMMIALWKVIPALAAGCTAVLKPSEVTPLTALRLVELAVEAGVPAGVLNLVTGDGRTGAALVEHPLVAKVSFTGSTATGRAIARIASDRMLRTSLELGGKNPAIFLSDCPIDRAVSGAVLGGFFNTGQVCAASSRLYVARSIYDDFKDALRSAVEGLPIGPGADPSMQINPVVSAAHRDKILQYVKGAQAEGAQILTGGEAPDRAGFFVKPTVIVDASPDSRIVREEVFGPLVTITPFDDEEDAIRQANDTEMGLAASIWTNDLSKALNYVPRIKAGTVWVNCHNLLDPAMPFGGYKQSGLGRDFGSGALDAFTEVKSVCIAH